MATFLAVTRGAGRRGRGRYAARRRSYQRDISSIAIHDAAAQAMSDHSATTQPAWSTISANSVGRLR